MHSSSLSHVAIVLPREAQRASQRATQRADAEATDMFDEDDDYDEPEAPVKSERRRRR